LRMNDPRTLASLIWSELNNSNTDALDERSSDLVSKLRKALELPSAEESEVSRIVPTDEPEEIVVLEPVGDHYLAKAARSASSDLTSDQNKVIIETRKGPLVVDSDDPLARAQRQIARLGQI